MENKEDLVNRLLKEGKVTFKEACVLMDMQSNSNITYPHGPYYWNHSPQHPFYNYVTPTTELNKVIC